MIPALAQALAAVGEQDRAKGLADSVVDTGSKAEVLLAVAKETTPGETRKLVAEALVLGRWTKSLGALAEVEPLTVLAVAEEFLGLIAPALAAIPVSEA